MSAADGLVNAVGVVLGTARDSFGFGGAADGGVSSTAVSSPVFAAAVFGSGQTAAASSNQSNVLNGLFSSLGEQDAAANANLQGALVSSGAGRGQMDNVIAATLDDVTGLAPGSNTNGGLLALVDALAGRLEEAWQVLTTGNAQASTQTGGLAQGAANYNSLVSTPGGGVASTGALSSMGGLSTAAATQPAMAGMTPMQVWVPTSALAASTAASTAAQAASAQQSAASTSPTTARLSSVTSKTGQPKLDPIASTSQVGLTRNVAASGKAAATGYINQALNIMGITDPSQRNTWATGLLWAMGGNQTTLFGESSYNPSAVNPQSSNPSDPGQMLSDGYRLNNARGILQCIPTTFAANHQAGTSNNIYDPVANICAAMWYVHNSYGVDWSGSNLASNVQAFRPGSSNPGY